MEDSNDGPNGLYLYSLDPRSIKVREKKETGVDVGPSRPPHCVKADAPPPPSPSTRRVTPGAAAHTFGPGWVVIGVSTTPDALRSVDAAVLKLKQAGIRRMSRSWLYRIAVERLDLDAVLAELQRVRP